jgi:Spy/CpxP family protein refolding chaperone
MKHNGKILTLLAALLFSVAATPASGQSGQSGTRGQVGQPSEQQTAPDSQQTAGGGGGDLIRQLNLTPEQREQIRSIREQNRAERATINQRLRETNDALEEALNAEEPLESVIEQRVRDLAAAQAAAMRIRVLTEIRIRRVLTIDQRRILRDLQQEAIKSRQERRLDNAAERQRRRQEQNRSLQNPRNTLRPLNPRRNAQPQPRP